MTKDQLRTAFIESLETQGFSVNGEIVPISYKKSRFKKIQAHSKIEQFKLQRDFLVSATEDIEPFVRSGNEINPDTIRLELRAVEPASIEEKIYRWWNIIWWSVPYQKAYGRQIRLLLWDTTHNAPFGIVGLQSPVLKMAVRDQYLKIPSESLDLVINKSMQAQRLGALPPYNKLLGGKMAAMSLVSNELRDLYKEKYRNSTTLIRERVIDADLLFLTTTSAFGRSSTYNRLKYNDEWIARSLGYTQGSGTFHVTQDLYGELLKFLKRRKIDVNTTFGYGASRKVKLIDQGFKLLNLNKYHYHNLQREFFLFSAVRNLEQVIVDQAIPDYQDWSIAELQSYWKSRWALPRSLNDESWRGFNARNFIIASKRNITRWSK